LNVVKQKEQPIAQRPEVKEEEPVEYFLIIPSKEEPKDDKKQVVSATASVIRSEQRKKQGFECDYQDCDYVGKTKYYLRAHQGTHTRPFHCNDCEKRCGTQMQLKRHRLIAHVNPNAFQCYICKKSLITKWSLMQHLETHNELQTKPFKCLDCQWTFRIKNDLKKHEQRIHSGNQFHDSTNNIN